jgi:acyl dehydratase
MEVTPMVREVGAVIGVTIAVAIPAALVDAGRAKTATPKDGRRAKASTMDRHPATSEAAAMKAAAAKASAATAAKTAATMATATVPNFGRQPIGCILRSRSGAGTCE